MIIRFIDGTEAELVERPSGWWAGAGDDRVIYAFYDPRDRGVSATVDRLMSGTGEITPEPDECYSVRLSPTFHRLRPSCPVRGYKALMLDRLNGMEPLGLTDKIHDFTY